MDECPAVIEIDGTAEFDWMARNANGVHVGQEPEAFFLIAREA